MSEQAQLFDAGGPVRTRSRPPSAAPTRTRACLRDGCDEPRAAGRRLCAEHAATREVHRALERPCKRDGCGNLALRRHQHCTEHATSIDYRVRGNLAPTEQRTCACGATFAHQRRLVNPISEIWHEFCPDCRRRTPLSLKQLQAHSVPADLVRRWLRLGEDLPCAVCGRRLTKKMRSGQPVIDHDHACCKGDRSCGACVRGVLCVGHNTAVGFVEMLNGAGLLEVITDYIREGGPIRDF